MVAHLGWVAFIFISLPGSAWADGSLAELAGQLGNLMEHPNQSQPNPGERPPESPCNLRHTSLRLQLKAEQNVDLQRKKSLEVNLS